MPSYRDLYPDKWLKPEIIGAGAVLVTIERAAPEELFNSLNKKYENKLILAFVGKDLRLVCNKTQCVALASLCGTEDYTLWKGKRVRLSVGRANNGKDTIVISPATEGKPPAVDNPWNDQPPLQAVGAPASARPQDENFYPDDRTAGELAPAGARPDNSAPCLFCHAPAGKAHASNCPTRSQQDAAASARPVHGQASAGARPQSLDQRVFARACTLYGDSSLQQETKEFIRKCRNADSDSSSKLTDMQWAGIRTVLQTTVACEEMEVNLVLAALLGYQYSAKRKPGQLVHAYLLKPMRALEEAALTAILEILEACQAIYGEEAEKEEEYATVPQS